MRLPKATWRFIRLLGSAAAWAAAAFRLFGLDLWWPMIWLVSPFVWVPVITITTACMTWDLRTIIDERKTSLNRHPSPNVSAKWLFDYLRLQARWSLQFASFAECVEKSRTEIHDQLSLGKISSWGRRGSLNSALEIIPREVWSTNVRLDYDIFWFASGLDSR